MVRFKNRYIVAKIECKDGDDKEWTLKPFTISNSILSKIQELYGDFGYAAIKPGFSAKYCNPQTKIALIKSRHGPHNFLIDAIPLVNDIAGKNVKLKILYIGATMKHCFLYIKKYQQDKLVSMWGKLKNDKEKEKMISVLMTLSFSFNKIK